MRLLSTRYGHEREPSRLHPCSRVDRCGCAAAGPADTAAAPRIRGAGTRRRRGRGHPRHGGARRARHWRHRRLRRGAGGARALRPRAGQLGGGHRAGHRAPRRVAAHGGQPVLGAGTDARQGAHMRCGGERRSGAGPARRGATHSCRRRRRQSPDGRSGRELLLGRGCGDHPLQYRLARHRRLWYGARRDSQRLCRRQDRSGLCRRNPAVAARGAAHRLGAGAGRQPGHPHRRRRCRPFDEAGRRDLGHRRLRPHRRQRRRRQQNRHLQPGGGGALARREVHGGGADLDRRHEDQNRRGNPHREPFARRDADAGRPAGGGDRRPGLEPVLRYHAGRAGGCDRHREGHSERYARGEDGGDDGGSSLINSHLSNNLEFRAHNGMPSRRILCFNTADVVTARTADSNLRRQSMYQRSFTALFSFLFLLAFFLPGTSSARWQWANPLPQGETLRGLAFNGSDAYVAVGTNGTLLVSADTTNWAPVYVSFRSTLNVVNWSFGLFVAVGKAGVLLSSLDGIDWTARESGTSNDLNDVVWGNNQLVAVGANTTLLTSGDGVTWISRSTNQEAGNLAAIVWTGTRYLVANNNYYGNIYSSNDAIAWTRVYRDPAMSLRDIVWTSSGFFVTTSRTNIVYSATGAPKTWGAYYSRTEQALYGLVWDGSKVLAAGSGGTILAIRGSLSVNPNVSNVASTGMQEDLTAIVWGGDQFVAVGNNTAGGSTVKTSPDGVAWTPRNAGAVSELSGVIWSGAGYLAYSRAKILLSADGGGWEAVTTLPYLNQVVWAGDKFVALFDDPATGANIAVSSDGRSWDSYQSGFSETLRSITWSGTRLVGVGNGGRIAVS